VLDRGCPGRIDVEAARGFEVDVGCGLAVCDLFGRDGCLELVRDAHQLEGEVDQLAVRGGSEAEWPALGEAFDGFWGPGDDRELLAVAALEAADDLGAALLGPSGAGTARERVKA